MGKKTIVVLLVGLVLASVHSADAQQPKKLPKIGFLSSGGEGSPAWRESFAREFGKLGYFEGKNVAFEFRNANTKYDRLPALAEELVRLKALLSSVQKQTINLAAKNRLPTIYHRQSYVANGGLMSYGPDDVEPYRRAATYVDKILKGAAFKLMMNSNFVGCSTGRSKLMRDVIIPSPNEHRRNTYSGISSNLLLLIPVVIGLVMHFKILNIFWKFQLIVCSTTRTAKISPLQQWRRLT